jgi:hypothetical protein
MLTQPWVRAGEGILYHAVIIQRATPLFASLTASTMWQLRCVRQAADGARRYLHRHSWHYSVAGLRQKPSSTLECKLGDTQGANLERLRKLRALRKVRLGFQHARPLLVTVCTQSINQPWGRWPSGTCLHWGGYDFADRKPHLNIGEIQGCCPSYACA